INLSEDVTPNVGMTSMSVILNYNGTAGAKNVKLHYKHIRGTWTAPDITKVTATSDNNYLVEIDGLPANDATVTLRAVAGEKASDEITIAKGGFTIESSPNDIFATRARIVPTYFEEEIEAAASSVKYEISENGTDYTAVNHTLADDGSAWISGLPAGKTLSVMATIGSKKAKVEITTETAAQLPNSDLEGWWREHGGSNWDFYYAYAEGTPQVWDTMNEETTSSVGVGAAYTTTSGTKPATGVNGQCAVVRTVGWGAGNTAGGSLSKVNNVTAGQLYLGKFKSVGQEPDYGYGFNSRPSELTFQAKYEAAKSDDFGSAEVRVLDASGNILASNSVNIGTDKSAWTEISLSLSYSANAAKASTIVVIFKSTAHSSGASKSYLKLPAFAANAKTESVGGQLYIDDIKLNY
ncbi:MAG: PCMD domain-containing protein, partial [Muribaculaceae bacterium]|nr:PCMD domain-containing protein [Muribaculaceae bacterium]